MPAEPRVAFVGHDASRSGAPIVLANLLRWLGEERRARASLLLRAGGPLAADLRALVATTVAPSWHGATDRALAGIGAVGIPGGRSVAAARDRLGAAAALRNADVVVLNTLASVGLALAAPRRTPVACWVHELDGVAHRLLGAGPPLGSAAVARVDRWIAAGPAVAEMLVDRWGLGAGQVVTVDEFVDPPPSPPLDRREARERLGHPGDEVVVVATGATSRRKGIDRFVATLAAAGAAGAEVSGTWIGGSATSTEAGEARSDAAAAGLGRRFSLAGETAEARRLLTGADLALTTSREDPYPLVVLEAALAGVAVAGFASGGAAHALRAAGSGHRVAADGDVLELARSVAELAGDPAARAAEGARLQAWATETHTTDRLAPRLWSAITETERRR